MILVAIDLLDLTGKFILSGQLTVPSGELALLAVATLLWSGTRWSFGCFGGGHFCFL
jgi:hypothetical protein